MQKWQHIGIPKETDLFVANQHKLAPHHAHPRPHVTICNVTSQD